MPKPVKKDDTITKEHEGNSNELVELKNSLPSQETHFVPTISMKIYSGLFWTSNCTYL